MKSTETLNFIVIDDYEVDLKITRRLIERFNLGNVITFSNAFEGLEYIKKQEGLDLSRTIVLLDLKMPGMNGFEFVDEYGLFSEHLKSYVKIFMLSSTVDRRDIDKIVSNEHILHLLHKPLDIETLKALLHEEHQESES